MSRDNGITLDDVTGFDLLEAILEQFGMSDPTERTRLRDICAPCFFTPNEMLYRSGDAVSHVYFICSGLVRYFYLSTDGKEHNKSFIRESQFAGAYRYPARAEPHRFHIQALEPTLTLAIPLDGLHRLYRESLSWANFGRVFMEELVVRKTDREAAFLLDSAEERYQRFLEQEPMLAERLPLYHIASYIGVTDVALSRIRKRLHSRCL